MNRLLGRLADRQRLAIGTHHELYGPAVVQRERQIRLQRRVLFQPVQLHVGDYADYFVPRSLAVRSALSQAFPNRVLTWPQTTRQRFVDHGNGGCVVHVGFAKSAARTQWHTHRRKKIGADRNKRRMWESVRWWHRFVSD